MALRACATATSHPTPKRSITPSNVVVTPIAANICSTKRERTESPPRNAVTTSSTARKTSPIAAMMRSIGARAGSIASTSSPIDTASQPSAVSTMDVERASRTNQPTPVAMALTTAVTAGSTLAASTLLRLVIARAEVRH